MTPEDLDRILGSEELIAPSSGFAASVVERTREEATMPRVPFPWRRFVLGLLVTVALSGVCGWTAARMHGIDALDAAVGQALVAFADPRLPLPLAGAAASIVGTYLLVRLTLGFTETRR